MENNQNMALLQSKQYALSKLQLEKKITFWIKELKYLTLVNTEVSVNLLIVKPQTDVKST